jgi:Cys-tRNA(Pro)/Cys-tRNA(Cys) deacylase
METSAHPSDSTPVSRVLQAMEVPHRLFRHAGKLESLEQAARERGQRPDQVVRSIVFRLGEGEYVMVLVAGPKRIAWPGLRRYLGQSRLTLAREDEVLQVTGYPLGAVSPLGLTTPMRILVDHSVLAQEEISLGSGERYATIIMNVVDLMSTLGEVDVGEFAQD